MNTSLLYLLYSVAHKHPWLDALIWFVAVPFIYIMLVVVALILIIQYKVFSGSLCVRDIWMKGRKIFWIFFSTGIAWLLATYIKILIHTDRPFLAFQDIQSLFPETGYAFPSAHSATIAALAFAVYFRNKRLGYVCLIAALLIGLVRVMAGVHFPIDIIGGYTLGFLVAFFLKSR